MESSCDIVSKYFVQISQMKPDLIIKPHGRGIPKVIWDYRSPTPVRPTLDWCGSSDGPISLRRPFAMWFCVYSSGIDSNRSYQCIDQPEVIGVVAFQIDSRPANLPNSTLLSRTSGPCNRGSIKLVVLNTESYGRQPVLENLLAGKRQKQIFVIERVDHCQSQPSCTVALHSLWATTFSTKTNLKDPERLIIRLSSFTLN